MAGNELIIPIKYVIDGSDLTKAGAKVGALTSEEKKLEAEMNDVANAARRQATEFNRAGDAGVKAAKNVEGQYNVLGNTIGSLGGIIAGVFAVDQLIQFGKAVVNTGAEFQSLRLAIDFASGSAAEGAKNFLFLQEISQRLGIDLMGAAQGFKQIVASSSQAGITNSETRRIFESVATAARAMGLSTNDMNGIFLALSQVISKGTVQAEELRGQIGERLPGAFNIAARAMGVTTQELNKMLEQGQVLSKDFLPAFATELQKTFEGALPAAVNSTRAEMSRLSTTWDEALNAMSNRTDGFVHSTVEWLNFLAFGLKKLLEDPVLVAKDNALANVTDFEAQMLKSLRSIADRTKEAGGDVNEAIESTVSGLTAKLTSDLGSAQRELDDVNAKINNIPAALQAFGLPKALTNALAEATARVSLLTGELGVLATIGSKLQEGGAEGDKQQLGRIEELRLKIKEITTERDKQVNLTQKEANQFNQRIATLQKELDLLTKITTEKYKQNDRVKYIGEIDILEKIDKADEEAFKKRNKRADYERDQAIRNKNAEIKAAKERNEALALLAKERLQLEQEIQAQLYDLGAMAAGLYLQSEMDKYAQQRDLIREKYDHEIEMAGDNSKARKALEEKEKEELGKIAAKEAKLKQKAALFEIGINAAEKAFAIKAQALVLQSNPLTAPLAPMAWAQLPILAASTMLQTGFVLSQKIPGYLKGTRKVPGTYKGKDEVFAMLAPEERVITAEKNRAFSPAFDVLTDTKRSPQFWNKVLPEIEKLGILSPNIKDLPPVVAGNADLLEELRELKSIMRGLPIHQAFIDEKGFTKKVVTSGATITKLNKRYDY